MIEIRGLTKQYDGVTVLNIPQLSIPDGESFGLVGNNGAGKTTLFSLLLDLVKPTSGEILSGGKATYRSDHWKTFTGSYLDERFLIDFLTPEEYLSFVGETYHLSAEEREDFLVKVAPLFNGEILGRKKLIRDLSKGNQKKLGIAAALMSQPPVLVLDEPFPHLDPSSVLVLKRLLQEIDSHGRTTMLISSHDLAHVTEVCRRIVLLEKGEMLKDLRTGATTLRELEEYFARIRA
jgi:ABC-2 type transport system ATP-binding protein